MRNTRIKTRKSMAFSSIKSSVQKSQLVHEAFGISMKRSSQGGDGEVFLFHNNSASKCHAPIDHKEQKIQPSRIFSVV